MLLKRKCALDHDKIAHAHVLYFGSSSHAISMDVSELLNAGVACALRSALLEQMTR